MNMKLLSRAAPALLVSTLLLGGMTPAMAQPNAGNASNGNQAAAPGLSIEQMAHERLSRLYDALRIAPNQQPAWNQFAQTSLSNATNLDQLYRQRADNLQSMDAVQNMQTFTRIQAQQTADMQRLLPAFQNLYSQLSPRQRQAADEMFRGYAERGQPRISQR